MLTRTFKLMYCTLRGSLILFQVERMDLFRVPQETKPGVDGLPMTADLSRCFLGGDSAGGNITIHVGCQAVKTDLGPIKLRGIVFYSLFISSIHFGGGCIRKIKAFEQYCLRLVLSQLRGINWKLCDQRMQQNLFTEPDWTKKRYNASVLGTKIPSVGDTLPPNLMIQVKAFEWNFNESWLKLIELAKWWRTNLTIWFLQRGSCQWWSHLLVDLCCSKRKVIVQS